MFSFFFCLIIFSIFLHLFLCKFSFLKLYLLFAHFKGFFLVQLITMPRSEDLICRFYRFIVYIQGDQSNMALFLWYLIKSDFSNVRYCTRVHWTSHFSKVSKKTRPYLTGDPVHGQRAWVISKKMVKHNIIEMGI